MADDDLRGGGPAGSVEAAPPSPAAARPPPPSFPWRTAGALAALAVLVYLNALPGGFTMDDGPVVEENARVHDLARLPELWTRPYWDNYRPVTLSAFALQWSAGGGDPAVFHGTSVLLHGAVTLLLFTVLLRLGAPRAGAAAGAALFAVHPVHVEAVANVVGQAEVWMALFTLAAALLYLRTSLGPWARAGGVAVCYALALGSKENGVMLPALLLLLEAFRAGRLRETARAVRRELPTWGALGAVGLGYAVARRAAVGTVTLYQQQAYGVPVTTSERILTAVSTWPEYVRLLFFPRDLSIDYGPGVLHPASGLDLRVAAGLAVGAGALLVAVTAWKRRRWLSLAVLWFAVTVFPVSNLLVGVGVWLAERTLYLPSAAVAIVAVPAALALRAYRRAGALALAVLVLLGAARTWTRTPVWASTETVLDRHAEEHPTSYRAQWHVGLMMTDQGRHEEALAYVGRALEMAPRYGQIALDYARLLGRNGRPDEVEAFLRERATLRIMPEWYRYMTQSFLDRGRWAEAEETAIEGLGRHPDDAVLSALLEVARANRARR